VLFLNQPPHKMMMRECIYLLLHLLGASDVFGDVDLDLPPNHRDMLFSLQPHLAPPGWKNIGQCWGFEENCKRFGSSNLSCPGDFNGWADSISKAEELFFKQADFGYIREQREEIRDICRNSFNSSTQRRPTSSLRCTSKLKFCEAENVMIDFRGIKDRVRTQNLRYKMDVLSEGDIQIDCDIDEKRFISEQEYMSPLQSWAPELRNIRKSEKALTEDNAECDVYMSEPVYIMKLDAAVNMYHHFCDFFNLYMSIFIKSRKSGVSMFDTNNQVLIWESIKYQSNFRSTWEAFTANQLMTLENVAGQRVCFRNVVFPLLPRMLFGLFYNSPIIAGCQDSALFHAFKEFITHRLRVPSRPVSPTKLRVTLLSRRTKYRRVLNEYQLIQALNSTRRYTVDLATFDHMTPFKQQLEVVRNTDILIGMHGAGLTHLLFLPVWSAVFELHHCDDPACYSDLARLRGLKYATWENDDKMSAVDLEEGAYKGPAHQKFRNYRFDVDEFVRLVHTLGNSVLDDKRYIKARQADTLDKEMNIKDKEMDADNPPSPVNILPSQAGSLSSQADKLARTVDTYARPADTNARPTDTNARPADTNARPTDTNARPADTNARPADTNARPADTNARPADTNARPADTLARPAADASKRQEL